MNTLRFAALNKTVKLHKAEGEIFVLLQLRGRKGVAFTYSTAVGCGHTTTIPIKSIPEARADFKRLMSEGFAVVPMEMDNTCSSIGRKVECIAVVS